MKTPRLLSLSRACVGLLLLSLATRTAAQNACDSNLYGQFIDQVQSLGPQTEQLGRQLLACPRDDFRQAAVYWLSFSYAMQGQKPAISELSRALPSSGSGSEKVQVLQRAWSGDVSGLANRVRLGQQGYADDAVSLLVLARNLIRVDRFNEGLAIYQRLISMPEASEAAEVEKLYALIWSQDFEAAAAQVAALRRFELSAYLKQSVDRADTLLEKLRGHPKTLHEMHEAWLTAEADDWVDLRGYRRRSLAIGYNGPVRVSATAIELNHPLELEVQREALFEVGRNWKLANAWNILTELGYFTGGEGELVGRVDNFWKLSESWQIAFGLRREAVALTEIPLSSEAGNLLRHAVKAGMSFQKRVVATAEFARDGDETPFALYHAELRFLDPIDHESDQGFGMFIPFDMIQHPQPASDTLSYPLETKIGLGLRAAFSPDQKFRFFGETRLEVVSRSYYQDASSLHKLLGAAAQIEARYLVERSYYLYVAGERSYLERNPDEKKDERRSLVTLGIALIGKESQ